MNSVKAACCVLALALLASAPALASYQICMTHCMKQHADFDRCHKTCVEAKAPANGASAGPGAAKQCSYSHDKKVVAALKWVKQNYDFGAINIGATKDKNVLEVAFNLYEPPRYCELKLKFGGDCRIDVLEVVEGDGC